MGAPSNVFSNLFVWNDGLRAVILARDMQVYAIRNQAMLQRGNIEFAGVLYPPANAHSGGGARSLAGKHTRANDARRGMGHMVYANAPAAHQ